MPRIPAIMTARAFLDLAGGKVSPQIFLEQHKSFLLGNDGTAAFCQPIYEKMAAGGLFPTPALGMIRSFMFSYMVANDLLEAEQKRVSKLEKEAAKEAAQELKELLKAEKEAKNPKKEKPKKKYIAVILDERQEIVMAPSKDGELVSLVRDFDLYQAAERWCARRIQAGNDGFTENETKTNRGAKGWTGSISAESMVDSNGKPIVTVVTRNHVTGILSPKRAGTVCKHKPKEGNSLSLSFATHKSSHCAFSRG